MVNVAEVIKMGLTQYGHPYSGDYDMLNGNHPWAYWCLAYVESTHRNLGLTVIPQSSAYYAGLSFDLQQGRAPLGAAVFFGQEFYYPDGHVAISLGNGMCLGTLTDGTGVGVRVWNETTVGYMGWTYYDGVSAEEPIDPPMNNWYVQPDNPHQLDNEDEIGIGGGFLRYYDNVSVGQDPYTVLGYAMKREYSATVIEEDGSENLRTIQPFERGTLIYQPENPFPWDVVMAKISQHFK